MKYVGCEHAIHLQRILGEHYKVATDWTGKCYLGIHLHWDTQNVMSTSMCRGMSKRPSTNSNTNSTSTNTSHSHMCP
ncbi:hypothetical protein ACHAW6_008254 [Cyclotella cf. meneghiniana]